MNDKPKPRGTLERQLAELQDACLHASEPAARALVQKALGSARAPLVAAAAKIAGEAELSELTKPLAATYEKWLAAGDDDPLCMVKTATVRALYQLGARADALFLGGVRLVQLVPVWGGSEDCAGELRGLCALALVRCGYVDALNEAAELLADPEPAARVAAAQAIAYSERSDIGVPLLRYKARAGDVHPQVVGACLSGLLSLAPQRSLDFVASFLGKSLTRTVALIAMGESRLPEALTILQRAANDLRAHEEIVTVYIAIAMLRSDAAWAYLVDAVRTQSLTHARAALSAMSTYRSVTSLRERVLAAVRERGDAQLWAEAEEQLLRE